MAAISSILIGAAAVAGVAGTVVQHNQQKKAQKAQERRLRQQELEAKNAAALEKTREDTGAKVKLGAQQKASRSGTTAQRSASSRTGTVGNSVGGLGASAKLGL